VNSITEEEAKRTEHLPDCAGYEDCDCFSRTYSHREIYDTQAEIARLSKENEDLRDALSLLYSQNKCGCGHPACNRCENDRIAEEALGIESEKPC
jgi:hypothetical protein